MMTFVLFLGLMTSGLCQDILQFISVKIYSVFVHQGSFYISQDKSKWSEQNRNCSPATPIVRAAADTDYQVTDRLGIDLSLNERVWVGYYQVARVFEYIGCVSMQSLYNYEERPFVEITGDPGHCFPGCGDDIIIGVTRNRCYCLGSDFNVQHRTETECTDKCNGPFVACGKDTRPIEYSYLSIYKMNTNVTAATTVGSTKEMNCLKLEPTVPKRFLWDKCLGFMLPMCTFGDYVRTVTSEGKLQYFSWTGAANICFNNKAFPTTYSNSKLVDRQNGSYLWTGMFVTNVVHRHNAKIPVNRRHDSRKFGYLTRESDNNVKLQFTDTDSDNRRLCDTGVKKVDISIVITSKLMTLSTPVTTFIYSLPSKTTKNVINAPNDTSPAVSILTGICVLLVVVLIGTVVLAGLYRRRMSHNESIQVNYLTPEYMAAMHGYNAQVSYSNNTDLQNDNTDLVSQHYYTTPTEVAYRNDKALQQVANKTNEMLQCLEIEGRGAESLESTVQKSTGAYESLQDRTTEAHNYETPTIATYESVRESMKDVHVYGQLQD